MYTLKLNVRGDRYMKDVVLNEVIDEEIYQNFKKEIGKRDDYLNIEEYKKLLEKLT